MTQKFDSVIVDNSQLVLKRADKETRLPIKKDKELVSKFLSGWDKELEPDFENNEIALSELKTTPLIDIEKQKAIKDHIDDLVFALYFNIDIPETKISDAKYVKALCQKNKFYLLVNNAIKF
ncbi:MAG: hypothetical protein HYW63_00300 [Candidatus Levybacteria bacterium]|nr:hypothetical protein [Candidatus Levybacteria bacterium]